MAALEMEEDDVYVRVVDVGAGLCAVVRVPGNHFMLYDAGHWIGQHCINAVRDLVTGDAVDLMVVSHSDGDHLGDGARILGEKRVRQTILTGEPRETASWRHLIDALADEVKEGGSVFNLQSVSLVPATRVPLGEAVGTLVAGCRSGPIRDAPRANAGTQSVSSCASTTAAAQCCSPVTLSAGASLTSTTPAKDAEKVMVDRHNAGQVSLKSDALIASHHGGNKGSAACFIEAIDPEFVIFSAGHDHQHPTHAAATRFLNHGLAADRLFRTDFGDDEAGTFEWKLGSVTG